MDSSAAPATGPASPAIQTTPQPLMRAAGASFTRSPRERGGSRSSSPLTREFSCPAAISQIPRGSHAVNFRSEIETRQDSVIAALGFGRLEPHLAKEECAQQQIGTLESRHSSLVSGSVAGPERSNTLPRIPLLPNTSEWNEAGFSSGTAAPISDGDNCVEPAVTSFAQRQAATSTSQKTTVAPFQPGDPPTPDGVNRAGYAKGTAETTDLSGFETQSLGTDPPPSLDARNAPQPVSKERHPPADGPSLGQATSDAHLEIPLASHPVESPSYQFPTLPTNLHRTNSLSTPSVSGRSTDPIHPSPSQMPASGTRQGEEVAADKSALPGGVVWSASTRDVSRSDPDSPLAFGAVVTPAAEAPSAGASMKPDSPSVLTGIEAASVAPNPAASAAPNPAASAAPIGVTPDIAATDANAAAARANDPAAESRVHKAEAADPMSQPDDGASRWSPVPPPQPGPATRPTEGTAKPPAPAAGSAPEMPQVVKPAAQPVRDIKLDLGAGDGRVEVRVADCGGEVRVAVHTADGRLAGDLREHLPSLSARLEQSGLRAETWHAAAGGGERMRAAETASSSNSQSPGGQGHQARERQQDPPSRRPKVPDQTSDQEKGNEFAWLMDALR
jgi:hypothetical protein